MRQIFINRLISFVFFIFLPMCCGIAFANEWPSQPIKLIVPFAPGASNDTLARALAKPLSEALRQTVVVENRPGAGGTIGAAVVAKSKPDGYTLLLTSNAIATASAVQDTPYDPSRDFDVIARIAVSPFVIVTRADLPAKNISELVALAKKNPGKMTYGTTGVGDNIHLASEMFARSVGVQMTAVPYKGVAPALADILGGRIDLIFTSVPSVKNSAAANLPIVAITSAERNPLVGLQYSTVKEQGVDFAVDIWWGVFGPSGLDPVIRERLSHEIGKILLSSQFTDLLNNIGAVAPPISYKAMQALLVKEVSAWKSIAIEAGLRK